MRLFRYTSSTLILLLIQAVNHIAHSQEMSELMVQTSEMHHLMVNYDADMGSLKRFYVVAGSPERRERFLRFHNEYLIKLRSVQFDQLSTDAKVDYILFKRDLVEKIHELDTEKKEYNQLGSLATILKPIYGIEQDRRRGKHPDSKALATEYNSLANELSKVVESHSKSGSLSPSLSRRAVEVASGAQWALNSVYSFYDGYDPEFSWWMRKPHKRLDSLIGNYIKVLKKQIDPTKVAKDDGSGIIGVPIGRDEIIRQLTYQMIPYTPEELIDIAQKEFAWCDKEMLKASQELGFGSKWKDALEKVKESYVPEGRQPEAIMDLYNQSIEFIKKNNMITIPPLAEETWRMSMLSPRRQLISPFFLGGELLQISYPTDDMEHEDKLMSMRGNNPHFSRATVHHELIAGHHLQGFMNRRYKTYRDFYTPFWTEGWALYWEMILWDSNFPRGPEDKIGMLFWRMHRCARIIFSLNYHLSKWTPQQCIDFLVDRVGHERANAEGEVRRSFTGGYGPLYQLAYMIGALQFYALKTELVDSGKITLVEFNDKIIRENNMPVEMVRAILLQQKLKENFATNWRFYQK